jgi:hypothetical protein
LGFNDNNFISPLFKLFGKKLANVPPTPVNGDVIQFNSTSQEWELVNGIVGSAVQSSSNVGTGDGLALPRVLDDLPFKTLVDNVEIVITVNPTTLDFSIGAIAISKITGLQVDLDSKIETITNVGGEKEIAKAKVGQNVDLRTLKAGTNITLTQNANDIEIESTAVGVVDISCKVTKSSNQSISNSTFTTITWDQENYDTDSMHDNVTNNSRITIKTAGKYSILAQSEWASNSTGLRILQIRKNGVDTVGYSRIGSGQGGANDEVIFVGDLAVNDYLELRVWQNSGGALDFRSGGVELLETYLEAHKIN